MSESALPRPLFDPAYKMAGGMPGGMDITNLDAVRKALDTTSVQDVLTAHPNLKHQDVMVPAYENGGAEVPLTIFEDAQSTNRARATLLYIHGGGQVAGTRFAFLPEFIRLVFPIQNNTVLATVEYRLAPEHKAPAGAHDCYAALLYLEAHAKELGIDPKRTMIIGSSGGAPLASAACMLARKNGYPHIRAQILNIPMIDDRDHWPSNKQFETGTIWPEETRIAWDMILGSDKGKPDVDELRSPGRAVDLSNLPPAYIDVGECEVFRDGAVAFASQIWKSGGSAELHVFPGIYHGASMFEPDVPVSKASIEAMRNFIQRMLYVDKETPVVAAL